MLIREMLEQTDNFSYAERVVVDYLLVTQEQLAKQSARFIAKEVKTAPSTITRVCQKMGFKGFDDFKQAYMQELQYLSCHFVEINPNYPILDNDKNVVVAHKMGQLYHEIIDDTLSLIEHDSLQAAISMLVQANTIYISCLGVQLDIAQTFKDKMLKIKKEVVVDTKVNESFYRAMYCSQKSVFIIISYSGETDSLLRIAKKLKERNISILVITTYGGNALCQYASQILYVSSREKMIEKIGDFSMNLATLLLLDILYMNIFNVDYQTNLHNKIKASKEFETFRKTNNPLLQDT